MRCFPATFRFHKQKCPRGFPRRGAALILVMVALLLVSVMTAALVQSQMRQHRQVRREVLRVQSHCCAAAGLQRAVQQLSEQPDYSGEILVLTPVSIAPSEQEPEAEVVIRVEPDGDRRQVFVTSTYPRHAHFRVQARRSLIVAANLPAPISALDPENVSP